MIDSHIDGLKAFLGRYTDFIEQRKLNKDPAGNEFQVKIIFSILLLL